jgi:ureidoglycolate lyase
VSPSPLTLQALSHQAFAPFGQVIEAVDSGALLVNDGTAVRFNDLAWIDVGEDHGRPNLSIFRAQPRALPMQIEKLERHPVSSQAFVPLTASRYLVVVAAPGPVPENLMAFCCRGDQGINFHRGTWHHPLLALDQESDFLVIDRFGPGDNCDEHNLREFLSLPDDWIES